MSLCSTCHEEFSEEFRIPKVLPCGHTYCLICLLGFFHHYKTFVCNECSYTINDINIIKKLPNNNALLKCIRQLKANKYRDMSPSAIYSKSPSGFFSDTQDTINFSHDLFRNYSPKRVTQPHDSFNFDGFKSFLGDQAFGNDKTFQRSATMSSIGRSKSPSRKINDIEINEKGVFREKSPANTGTCCFKECNNPRMYLKGSKQPFCNLHYAELYKPQPEQMMDPFKTPVRQFKPGFPQTFPNYITMSAPNYLHGSDNMNVYPNEMSISSQESTKSVHKFGKTSTLDLMKFYEKSPQTNQMNNSFTGVPMTNSSVFSGIGTTNQAQNLNQSVDFGKSVNKSIGSRTPFPTTPDALNQNKKMETENKCLIPNCMNQRLVYKGMTYPVCGRKCWSKWQNQPRGSTFWS